MATKPSFYLFHLRLDERTFRSFRSRFLPFSACPVPFLSPLFLPWGSTGYFQSLNQYGKLTTYRWLVFVQLLPNLLCKRSLTDGNRNFFSKLSISEPKHVQEFARSRVGVDAYGWLHRGIFSCASKICRGIDTKAYVDYCMHRVRMLIHFHITPVLVFDGAELPMKAETHADRRARREDAYAKAEAAYAAGDFRKAEEWYQRACPVTSEMARQVIRQCRQMNVEYVVAPYEADAQLAWMMASGVVDSIITEDSDLLVYGASRVLFKMTKDGHGDFFQSQNLPSLDSLSLNNFTEDMFMFMCVCAGCDFFQGVKGLGIRKAHPIVRRSRTLSRVIHAVRANSKLRVSQTFMVDFTRACLVFRHQTVYDMRMRATISLRELDNRAIATLPDGVVTKFDDGEYDLSFLGRFLDSAVAQRLAEGHIHPRTLKEYSEPLDIVERPIGFVEPATLATQVSSPPAQRKSEGFVVQPISQARSQSVSQNLSNPIPQSVQSQYKNVPNLRARLSAITMKTSSFNPRIEARRFATKNNSSTSQLRLATSSVWGKFRRSNVSKSSNALPNGASNVSADSNGTEEMCGNTKSKGTHEKPTGMFVREGDETTCLLDQTSQKEASIQDSSVLKRPRNPPSTNRTDAVSRAVNKFAMKPSEKALKFFANDQPPSPDIDSFRLFNEIDEGSRDGSKRVNESTTIPQTDNPGPRSSFLERNQDGRELRASEKKRDKSPSQQMHQLRVSRFFAQKGQDEKTVKSNDGEFDPEKKAQFVSPSGRVAAVMENFSGESKRAHKRKIDNFRRGATSKKIRANSIS